MFNRDVLIVPYIPHSCSLVWLQDESPELPRVKIYLSFTPRWFARRMELDYGKRWHGDPIYRWDRFVEMAEVLNREFPLLKPGGDPKSIKGGLSQIHTCAPMAALFGQKIEYGEDRWPDNTGRKLDDREALALAVPEIRNHWIYEDLLRQIGVIEREWGAAEGELNLQGVLNTAFRLRGESLFIDIGKYRLKAG